MSTNFVYITIKMADGEITEVQLTSGVARTFSFRIKLCPICEVITLTRSSRGALTIGGRYVMMPISSCLSRLVVMTIGS